MGNISIIQNQVHLSAVQSSPKSEDEQFEGANADIIFNILSNSTNPENVVTLVIRFQLTYLPPHDPNKYQIGAELTGQFLDPERSVITDLLSEASINFFASLYKHCGEMLLKELSEFKIGNGDSQLEPEDLEINKEHAIQNTRQIMETYLTYLKSVN